MAETKKEVTTREFERTDKAALPPATLANAPKVTEDEKELGLPAVVEYKKAGRYAGERADAFYRELIKVGGYGINPESDGFRDLSIRGMINAANDEEDDEKERRAAFDSMIKELKAEGDYYENEHEFVEKTTQRDILKNIQALFKKYQPK